MKNAYITPAILLGNGTITLTASQAARLGLGNVAEWDAFWADAEDSCVFPNFRPGNPDTWPDGFKLGDPDSWYILLGF